MKTLSDYGYLFSLSTCSVIILISVFIVAPEVVYGTITSKVSWFYLSMLISSACLLMVVIAKKGHVPYRMNVADWLVIAMAVLIAVNYKWSFDPAPHKLIFVCQLVFLWFFIRSILQLYPQTIPTIQFALVYSGIIMAFWGYAQLQELTAIYHSQFPLTGPFYNPGPYSGYLAAIFPLALSQAFHFGRAKCAWYEPENVFYITCLLACLLIFSLLPAGMSRTSWIAAIVSGSWVAWVCLDCTERLKRAWKTHRKWVLAGSLLVVILGIGAGAGGYLLKKDSADGRLFIWKITSKAIADNSFWGTGLGGFGKAYAEAQEAYFASGNASKTELQVAGSPEYAFNEYLQILLEEGIVGLLFYIGLLGYCFYCGIKNKQTGPCGGLIAIAIISFSSYPLQLPSFNIILVMILSLSMMPSGRLLFIRKFRKRPLYATLTIACAFVAFAGAVAIKWSQRDSYESHYKWSNLKILQQRNACEKALEGYESLYPKFNHHAEFLFEYAQCLRNIKQYDKANEMLLRASQLRADPMIYNVMAKNYQSAGKYEEAEQWLHRSINLMPERIYPYYLLTKLYAEPAYYNEKAMKDAAQAVMTKEPKVQTTAIHEMRKEIQQLMEGK